MTARDILRLLISGISIKRPAKEAGIAAATYIFVVWCAKMALGGCGNRCDSARA
jgi:hypothetical protein